MGSALSHSALRHYRQAGTATVSVSASPHKLIEMLYSGALDRLAAARGCLQRGDVPGRLGNISDALAIVEHLRLTLDFNAGGEIAQNLARLYDYMQHRLTLANADSDTSGLDEVANLLRTLKSAWEMLPQVPSRH